MFKVGDRVEVVRVNGDDIGSIRVGDTGTVLEETDIPFVRFDRFVGGGSAFGRCEEGHGYPVLDDQIKLIEKEEPTCATTA